MVLEACGEQTAEDRSRQGSTVDAVQPKPPCGRWLSSPQPANALIVVRRDETVVHLHVFRPEVHIEDDSFEAAVDVHQAHGSGATGIT